MLFDVSISRPPVNLHSFHEISEPNLGLATGYYFCQVLINIFHSDRVDHYHGYTGPCTVGVLFASAFKRGFLAKAVLIRAFAAKFL